MKTTCHIILFLAMAALLCGCASKNMDGDFKEFAYGKDTELDLDGAKHLKIAKGYSERGNYEMAFVHLNKAQEKDPGNIEIRVLKGELLTTKGQDELALSEFLAVLQAQPDHARANQGAGTIYFRAGLFDEAESHLSMAVTTDPSLWKAHNYLGILHDRRGEYDQAAACFGKALELHGGNDSAAILNNLGVVHIARKDYASAAQAFSQALQKGGACPRTYNNLGLALTNMNRRGEALEAFRYAGGEAKAYNNLGYVLLSGGQPVEAIPYFERALELSPSYYTMADENLKRARMAARFSADIDGSTPNRLSPGPFPSVGQAAGEAADVVKASAALPRAATAAKAASVPGPQPVQERDLKPDVAAPAAATPETASPEISTGAAKPSKVQVSKRSSATGDAIQPVYGIHVSSWQDANRASRDCERLEKRGFSTWINEVDLGERGRWHRVVVGRYSSRAEAAKDRPGVLESCGLDRAMIVRLDSGVATN